MAKQLLVHFKGMVQGVGFRYTTQRLAQKFVVTGYVRNLDNGHVEVVAEGSEEELKNFLRAIEGQMAGYIRDRDVSWSEAAGKYKHFSIAP